MPWLLNGVKGSRFSRKMTTFAPMEPKSILSNIAKILFPFILGGAILWWMYRGEDISTIKHVLTEEMNWTWMLLSFPFGILAQMFRGWRWKQTLEPMVEDARKEEGGMWNVECGRRNVQDVSFFKEDIGTEGMGILFCYVKGVVRDIPCSHLCPWNSKC